MGYIGTGNFSGYLLSVILAPRLIRRLRPRVVITCGLMLITLSMFCVSASQGFFIPLALYFLVGMGTGFANITTMALISHWFRSDQRGKAAGLMIGGNGAAIMLAGVLVPLLNRSFGTNGWRAGWLLLSIIALLVTVLAAWLVRNHPSKKGLEPLSRVTPPSPDQLVPSEHRGDGALLVRLGLLYYLGLSRAASAFATITIFFAAGQTVGPALAGVIAKTSGSFTGAYLLAALITTVAMIFALFLPRPDHASSPLNQVPRSSRSADHFCI